MGYEGFDCIWNPGPDVPSNTASIMQSIFYVYKDPTRNSIRAYAQRLLHCQFLARAWQVATILERYSSIRPSWIAGDGHGRNRLLVLRHGKIAARLASLQNLNLKISPSGGTHILVHSMINELVEYLTNTYHFSSMPSHLMESVSTWRSEDKLSQTTATLMNMPSALTGMLQTAYHS